MAAISHTDASAYESNFRGLTHLGGGGVPHAGFTLQLFLTMVGKDGTQKSFNLVLPAESHHPHRDFILYHSVEEMVHEIEKEREHRERIPKSLQNLLEKEPINLSPGVHLLTLQTIVDLIQGREGRVLYVDKRVKDFLIYIRIGSGSQVLASSLAEVTARAMGMYWRKVGGLYFLGCSPGDPLVQARMDWLAKHSAGLHSFLKAASSSAQYGGVDLATFLGQPEKVADADLGVLNSMSQIVEDTTSWAGKNGTNPAEFIAALSDPNFIEGTFQVSIGGSMNISEPPYLGSHTFDLSDERVQEPGH